MQKGTASPLLCRGLCGQKYLLDLSVVFRNIPIHGGLGVIFLESPNMGLHTTDSQIILSSIALGLNLAFLILLITGSNLYGAVHTKAWFNADQFNLGEVSQRFPTSYSPACADLMI